MAVIRLCHGKMSRSADKRGAQLGQDRAGGRYEPLSGDDDEEILTHRGELGPA